MRQIYANVAFSLLQGALYICTLDQHAYTARHDAANHGTPQQQGKAVPTRLSMNSGRLMLDAKRRRA